MTQQAKLELLSLWMSSRQFKGHLTVARDVQTIKCLQHLKAAGIQGSSEIVLLQYVRS